jgi:hypothetical protein
MIFSNVKNNITFFIELLTAISILFAGSLYIYGYIHSYKTEIKAVEVFSKARTVSLLISNTGGKDVAIQSIYIIVPEYKIKNAVEIFGLGSLIKSGETKLLESLDSKLNNTVLFNPDDFKSGVSVGTTPCTIVIKYVDIDSKVDQVTLLNECFAGSYQTP